MRKTFATRADARAWRAETTTALNRGTLRAPTRTTLAEAAADWLEQAKAGVIRTRSGEPYKPSALRAYEQALRARLLPELGHMRLSSITRSTVQDLADRLVAQGLGASSVRNAILPLRAIYRRALSRSEVMVNPTLDLQLPAVRARRERVARVGEADALIVALEPSHRALWGTAFYSGLRRRRAAGAALVRRRLRGGVIRVERSWDQYVGPITPKSRAGRRRVPLAQPLRARLLAHRLLTPPGSKLVFGRPDGRTFCPGAAVKRARRVWTDAGLASIGLHECRHTYAAFMIAAGVNAKALSTYMGHSSITMTLDRYGHLMPGNEGEAAAMLGSFLESERRR
jgi:integrase